MYRPTLLVVPIQMIPDWIRHIDNFTCGYTIYAYYHNVPGTVPSIRKLTEIMAQLPGSNITVCLIPCVPFSRVCHANPQ